MCLSFPGLIGAPESTLTSVLFEADFLGLWSPERLLSLWASLSGSSSSLRIFSVWIFLFVF